MRHRFAHTALMAVALLFFCAAALTFSSPPAAAQGSIYTPKVGSVERKAIMNALRATVESELKFRVIFVVTDPGLNFRVEGNWAFVCAEFRHPDGKPMGPEYYDPRGGDSNMSNLVPALLHRANGKWSVVDHDTGAIDVAWAPWSQKYHAPSAIFPKTP